MQLTLTDILYNIKVRLSSWLVIVCFGISGSWQATAQSKEIADLRKSLPLAKDSLAYVDMMNQLALYYHLFNTDSSFLLAVKARETASRLHYKKGIAGALRTLGVIYWMKSNARQAITYHSEALQLYRAMGDSDNVCCVLNNLSLDYESEQNDVMEIYYRQQAMSMGNKLSNDSMYSLVLSNYIIEYNTDSTKLDSVRWAYNKLRAITARYPYSREWLYAKMLEAVELLRQGHGPQGEILINKVADTALQKGFIHLAIAAYFRIIDDFIPLGYKVDSIPYCEKIFELSKKAGYYELMMMTLPALYRHYTTLKEEGKTAYYGNAIQEIANHQLGLRKSRQEINYLDYFLKEQEMKSLQLRNQVQQQAIEENNLQKANRRLQVWLLAGLLLLLITVTAIYYRSYRTSRQYERRLASMNMSISEKNRLLKANDDFKNKLISVVAHDFRDPLNNIIRVASLLQTHSLEREEMMEIIAEVEASSGKTLAVFDSILRWIKSQLSGFVYAPAPCNIKAMMTDALQSVQQAAQEKKVWITIDVPDNIQVAAEREMLQFVHRSLLNSAVNFAVPAGRIIIASQEEDGAVKVLVKVLHTITNPAMLLHVFEYRGTAYYRQYDAELALVICKDFMDKMGGHISATPEGEGFAFVYELPSFH